MGDEAGEAGVDDGLDDGWVVQFLSVVDLVAAGDAGGVVVGNELVVVTDGGDDVSFHDLHVVDVVEEFEARRVEFLADGAAEGGVVVGVGGVVDFGVEEFHDEGDVVFLGKGNDPRESFGALVDFLLIRSDAAVAGKADDLRDTCFGGGGDEGFVDFLEGVVVVGVVEGVFDAADSAFVLGGGGDGAFEAEGFCDDGFVGVEEVDAVDADCGGFLAEGFQGEVIEAPAADRVTEHGGNVEMQEARCKRQDVGSGRGELDR